MSLHPKANCRTFPLQVHKRVRANGQALQRSASDITQQAA